MYALNKLNKNKTDYNTTIEQEIFLIFLANVMA